MKRLIIAATLVVFLVMNSSNYILACDKSKAKDSQAQSGKKPEDTIKAKDDAPKEVKEKVNNHNKDGNKDFKNK